MHLREVLSSHTCGPKLEAALTPSELYNSRASGGVLPVQSSFRHGSATDWQSICAPLVAAFPIRTEAMQRQFISRTWSVGPCLFCRASFGGQVLRRTLEHISSLNNFVVISRYLSGHIVGATEGVPFGVRSGTIVLRDLSQRFEALLFPFSIELVFVPSRILGLHEADQPALRMLRQDTAEALPLQTALNEAFLSLSGGSDVFSVKALEQLINCAKANLEGPRNHYSPRQSARLVQRAAIDRFIEDNLSRLDLAAEVIVPEFGVSRATLYRLFEDEGGVRKYIVDRRLFRALLDISDGGRRRGNIQQAAKRWGFSSAANFNRSVRQVFGGTPGALFRARAEVEPVIGRAFGDPDEFRRDVWMSFHQ